MSSPSPICTVNGSSTLDGVNVTPLSTVTIALVSTAGVGPWSIQCTSTDETSSAATVNSSIVVNSTAKTATFTAPANGAAVILQSVVNGGVNQQTGIQDPSLRTTFGVYTTSTGNTGRVVAVNERLEGDHQFGWITRINNSIRAAASPSVSGALVDAASGAVSIGDCMCITLTGTVTRAVAAALVIAGSFLGVALNAAAPGGFVLIQIDGVIPPGVSGLNSYGPVAVNQTSGRCQTVTSYAVTDYPVGFSTTSGWCTMVRGLAIGGTSVFDFPQAPGFVDQFNGDNATTASWASSAGTNTLTGTCAILSADINGHSAASFNGTSQYMQTTTWTMNASTEWTCYAVMAIITATNGYMISSNAAGTDCVELIGDPGPLGHPKLLRGTHSAEYMTNLAGAGYHIQGFQARSDASNELFVDGTSRGTFTDASTNVAGNFLTLGRHPAAFLYSNYKIAYLVNYNQRHTTAQRNQVEAKLRTIFPSVP